jgi:predicted extracellular nuclease
MFRSRLLALGVLVFMVMNLVPLSQSAAAVSSSIVISQVYGGGGNSGATFKNDFIELYNRGATPVDLTGWSVQYAAAMGTSWQRTDLTSMSLAPGQYYLVQEAAGTTGGTTNLPTPDATGAIPMSATAAKVALVSTQTTIASGTSCPAGPLVVDLVGYGSATNCFEGTPIANLSNTTAAIRAGEGCVDTDSNSIDFAIGAANPRNTASPFHFCTGDNAPAITATSPLSGAVGVGFNTNIAITFSEPVDVSSAWYSIVCVSSGSHTAAQSGGPTTFTLDPMLDFAFSESCTVTVFASEVTDQDTVDPPNNMAANYSFTFTTETAPPAATLIHDIQGSSHVSPLVGQALGNVPGIVTAKRSNGFYLQDPNSDGNDATSEGVFVFTSSAPSAVSVGDAVRVKATVNEFRPGGAAGTTNLSTTELVQPTVTVLSHGNPVPAATVIGLGGRMPPTSVIEDDASTGNVETSGVFDPANDGLDFYESLEGMLVQINDPVIVGPTNSFNEIPVLPDDGSWAGPRTAHGGILYSYADGNPERIIVDDAIVAIPQGLNVGDHFAGSVTGVMDYNFGLFMVELTQSPVRVAGTLTKETTPPPTVNELTVATFNVQNLDPGDGAAKFANLAGLIVNNMKSPDLIAVEEVQDNNGATDDGVVDPSVTIGTLISAISTAGGPTYGYRQINPVNDRDGGEPGGNIRQIFMFRTDRGLSFVDRAGGDSTTATTVTNAGGTPQLSFSPGRIAPTDGAWNSSRKPLAAEFLFNAQRLYVIANHFNSKGGDQPLTGRFQPPGRSSEGQRHQQATIEAGFVQDIRAIDPNAKVVVLGDLNDFEFSETVHILEGAGLVDLYDTVPLAERYSYVFQGNSQTLDHIMVSRSLAPRSSLDVVHVNAEFADQASDHDPSVARVVLNDPPTIAAPADVSKGTGAGATTCAAVVTDAELGTPAATDDAPGVVVTRGGVPAGNAFPLGTTIVTYTATDAVGNSATATQRVIVTDTTPPSLTVPADAEYKLVSDVPAGQAGDATATDNCGAVSVTMLEANNGGAGSPASPLIITRTFTASDAASNTTAAVQTITVRVNEASLCALTRRLVTKDGVASSLCAKLANAAAARARGNLKAAQNILGAYVNEVNAQRGKAIPTEDADLLILLARGL